MVTYSGGCQCGAIRFIIRGPLSESSICHCRMCQKAFGSFFAPFVSTVGVELVWSRGEVKHYNSSNLVRRGFCAECGTPLTYEAADGIALSTGSFDEPQHLPPTIQYGIENKLPYCDSLSKLPSLRTEEDINASDFLNLIITNQHPDFDTPNRTIADD